MQSPIFKRLLLKLTTKSTYMFNSKFYKQSDGCTIGDPFSLTFLILEIRKLEIDQIQSQTDKHFVDDVINTSKKNTPDLLITLLNSYHPNINLPVEVNPTKFLDSNIKIETSVYRKPNKIPVHWRSKVPKRYTRNAINGDLNRSH